MRLLEVTPAPCMLCGSGNTYDSRGDRRRFLDMERDVNWNDPAILCEDCGTKVGVLFGLLTPDYIEEVKIDLKKAGQLIHDQQAQMDDMRRRAKRLGLVFDEESKAAA